MCRGTTQIWGLWRQRRATKAGISYCFPRVTVGCSYLSPPEMPASGTKVLVYLYIFSKQFSTRLRSQLHWSLERQHLLIYTTAKYCPILKINCSLRLLHNKYLTKLRDSYFFDDLFLICNNISFRDEKLCELTSAVFEPWNYPAEPESEPCGPGNIEYFRRKRCTRTYLLL